MEIRCTNPPQACSKCKFLKREINSISLGYYYTCQVSDWIYPVASGELIAQKFKPSECPF